MSNKNKKKNKKNISHIEKCVSYGTIIGLIGGLIIGTIIFIITDNMFWMALTPIVCLFIGLGIGTYLPKLKKHTKKQA